MNTTFKKCAAVLILTSSLLLISGCGGSTPTTPDTSNPSYTTYEKNDFTIQAPKDWEVLTSKDFPSNVPAGTLAVFRNNIKNEVFTANLSISQSDIETGSTSRDFSLKSLNAAKNSLVTFSEISQEELSINKVVQPDSTDEIADTTMLATFQGRKTITEPLITFKQFCIAKSGYGIIVTASYLPTDDQSVVIALDTMLKSFRLK